MSMIFNNRLKNKELVTSKGKIQFNAEGVADIQDEELVNKLLELSGYSLFDGEQPKKAVESPKEEDESTDEVDESTDEVDDDIFSENDEFTEESLSTKNVPQLRKIAKDNNIDIAGANKKDEIIAIIIGAMNK